MIKLLAITALIALLAKYWQGKKHESAPMSSKTHGHIHGHTKGHTQHISQEIAERRKRRE